MEFLNRKIERYLSKEQLFKSQEYAKLEKPYLAKSRKNFTVANLLFKISENDDMKKVLSLASGFEMYDWVIIVSYYSMYTSALAAISKLGFKSKSHAATITLLERFYVRDSRLEQKHLQNLSKAYALSEALITKLIQTKDKRETAQYDATPAISRENASSALRDADDFITRVEEILQ
ncbi:MAG TPA: HEPN domain-containing protein [Candidatus Hodarchaeales archaeon]|nr:HEPN domain-containing protein [Candidatus Hodarchaeales archaeon]